MQQTKTNAGKSVAALAMAVATAAALLIAHVASPVAHAAQPAEDAKAIAELAKRRYMEGQYDIAARLYLKAFELAKRPPLLFNAGRAREAAGQKAEAIEIYRQYIAIEKEVAGREEARARIEALGGDTSAPAEDPPAKKDGERHPEPAKGEPAKPAPAKSEPIKSEPAKPEPAKAAPAKGESAKDEPAKAEPAKGGAKADPGKGPWTLDKSVPFDKGGRTKVGIAVGPLTITEVVAKRVPTAGDIAKAAADDPNDTFHPVLQVGVTNTGTVEIAFSVSASFDTADGRQTIACDSKDSIDPGEKDNHTTLCTLRTMKLADWPKVSRVHVVVNARVR